MAFDWGDAFRGGSTGAVAGSKFGPYGAAIGGGLGALTGIMGGNSNRNEERQTNALLDRIPAELKQLLMPYISAGEGALGKVGTEYNRMITNPNDIISQIGSGYKESPGFQWRRDQGLNAITNAQAAGGMTGTGQHQQLAGELAENLASEDFGNYMNRTLGVYGAGVQGAQGLASGGQMASTDLASSLGDLLYQRAKLNYERQASKNKGSSGLFSDVLGFLKQEIIMPLHLSDFRPLDVRETSPLGGVLSDAIAKRLAMAQTEKAEAEVPYAGLASLAQTLSQLAYANAVQPQYAAKLAGNKQIWSNMDNAQHTAAVNLASAPGAAGGGGALAPAIQKAMEIYNQQNDKKNQPSLIAGLMNYFSNNQSQSEPSQSQMGGAPLSSPPVAGQLPQPFAPQDSGLPSVAKNLGDQPTAFQNEANYNAQQAAAEAQGTESGKQSAAQLKQAQDESANAWNMDQQIDAARNKYKDVVFKGPILGKLAEYGPDSQQLLKTTNQMQVTVANQLFGANSTNAKDAIAGTLKLTVKDLPKAFDEFSIKLKAENDRLKGKGTFYSTLNTMNVTDPYERDQIWFDYNAAHPPYDYKKGKPIYDNLGIDQQKFVKFIQKDRADANSLSKRIETTLKKQNSAEEKAFVNQVSKPRISPDQITMENLQHTAKENGISVSDVIRRLEAQGIVVPERIP